MRFAQVEFHETAKAVGGTDFSRKSPTLPGIRRTSCILSRNLCMPKVDRYMHGIAKCQPNSSPRPLEEARAAFTRYFLLGFHETAKAVGGFQPLDCPSARILETLSKPDHAHDRIPATITRYNGRSLFSNQPLITPQMRSKPHIPLHAENKPHPHTSAAF